MKQGGHQDQAVVLTNLDRKRLNLAEQYHILHGPDPKVFPSLSLPLTISRTCSALTVSREYDCRSKHQIFWVNVAKVQAD